MESPINLDRFIEWHLQYELMAFRLSNRAEEIGYPGFGHFYRVEAADALVHTRRIMNFMAYRDYSYHINSISPQTDVKEMGLIDLLKVLLQIKKDGLALTEELAKEAHDTQNYLIAKFFDWYLIDFFEEIDHHRTWIDYMEANENNIYKVERLAEKAEEPDTLEVIKPFNE